MKNKSGKMTDWEKQFIYDNVGIMHANEMAIKLKRTLKSVLSHIETGRLMGKIKTPEGTANDPVKNTIRVELKNSVAWKQLLEEFTEQEMTYFEEQYVGLKAQFKDDVYASEESQLFKAIKIDIIMHRNLVQQKALQDEINRLEKDRYDFIRRNKDKQLSDDDKRYLDTLDLLLETKHAQKKSHITEYVKLDEQYQAIMRLLKATREQRINRVESSRKSFLDIIRDLQERDVRQREGKQIEQMKVASQKELERLGRVHQYMDGNYDRPILSPDTVNMGDDDDE